MAMSIFARGLAVLGLAALPALAGAQAIHSTGQSFVEGRILPGSPVEAGRVAGLELKMRKGWKTYWRNPGESGVPPRFDFSGSSNLASAEVMWPKPMIFTSFGMRTVGYEKKVVLPIRLEAADPDRPIGLVIAATLGVCREICVFEELTLSEELAPGARGGEMLVKLASKRVPGPGEGVGIGRVTCVIGGAGRMRSFEARLPLSTPMPEAVVLLEAEQAAWFDEIRTEQGADEIRVSAEIGLIGEDAWIGRGDIRFTVLADSKAADIQGCAAPAG